MTKGAACLETRTPAPFFVGDRDRCGRLLLALQHHEVELRELGLAEREEHLDEQTVGRSRVGDDDRLARARILAGGQANLAIALAPKPTWAA